MANSKYDQLTSPSPQRNKKVLTELVARHGLSLGYWAEHKKQKARHEARLSNQEDGSGSHSTFTV